MSGSTPLPADFSLLLPNGGTIRHILLGTPADIHQTRHLLHNLRYVEVSQWSPLVQIPERRLVFTTEAGEQMSLLTRRLVR
ncbi:MAG: hypothetical protein AAFZ80_11775 [Cyanobacteria bacterium P01_A01_bin.105]